jgi:tetratricopeptide (TPR) repeat protein
MITKAVELPRPLRSLLSSPHRVALLLGSGVSIASGLPSGMAFNRDIVDSLAVESGVRQRLERCLITHDRDSGVRFEQVIEYISVCTPKWTNVFDIFDVPAYPNRLHYFAASILANGGSVFTTNFDSLIEVAFLTLDRAVGIKNGRTLRSVYEEGFNAGSDTSFEKYLELPHSPALFKLHGSIRRIVTDASEAVTLKRTDCSSVRAILARIGDRTAQFGLPPASSEVFARHLKNRILLVVGYSGLDDFDVLPSLCSHAEDIRGLIWIAHQQSEPNLAKRQTRIPKNLQLALRRLSVPCVVINGRTHKILNTQHMPPTTNIQTDVRRIGEVFPWMRTIESPERHLFIGMIFEGANEHRRALRSYRNAVRAALARRTFSILSIARRKLAGALRSQSLFHEALAVIRAGIKTDRDNNKVALADDYSAASEIYWMQGRYADARRLAIEALHRHRRLKAFEGQANDLSRLANVHWMRGEIEDAVRLTRAALRINRRLNRKLETSRSLINLGSLFRTNAKYKDAIAVLMEARSLQSALHDEVDLASTLNNLGSVYLDMGDLMNARRYYMQARDLNRKLGVLDHLATNIGNIGIVHRKRGEYKQALSHYQHAYRINRSIRKKEGQIRDSGNIGAAYLLLNRLSAAARWLNRSLHLSRRLGKRENEAIQLQNLGIIARRKKHYAQAIKLFGEALSINLFLKRPLGVSDLLHELGQVYLQQGNYQRAQRLLSRAYRIAANRGIREGIAVIARDLATTFAKRGNAQKAKYYGRISLKEFERLRRIEDVNEVRRFLDGLT